MSLTRKVTRRAKRTYDRVVSRGESRPGADGKPVHVLGTSQAEALAALREMPLPGGPGDEEYRRARNASKRARRERGGR